MLEKKVITVVWRMHALHSEVHDFVSRWNERALASDGCSRLLYFST